MVLQWSLISLTSYLNNEGVKLSYISYLIANGKESIIMEIKLFKAMALKHELLYAKD
jgi:hypothetical protein